MSKVYGYCRVALASKEEITEQMKMIAKYCQNNNLMVDGYFCDDGVTGFEVGEEFKHLFGELKAGDTVIIRDVSRLTRSGARAAILMDDLETMGVKLICVNGNKVDTSSIEKWLEQRWTK